MVFHDVGAAPRHKGRNRPFDFLECFIRTIADGDANRLLAAARCNVVFHKNANLQAAINIGRLACGLIVGYEPDHGDEQRERKEPKRTNMHFVFRLR